MNLIKVTALLLLVIGVNVNSIEVLAQNKTQQKPNIIFIITDDQGMGDLGCTGNPYIKTPNIDKFYAEAVRFTNYHVGTTCAPTRSAIMSGRHTIFRKNITTCIMVKRSLKTWMKDCSGFTG